MSKNDVVVSVKSPGVFSVYKGFNSKGVAEFQYEIEAKDEQEAYEKVFGIGSYGVQNKEDPYRDDPYLAFFRET